MGSGADGDYHETSDERASRERQERIHAENRALRVALDLWEKDLMERLANKIRTDTLSQFRPTMEMLVLAAKNLAMATPDRRLRSELDRYVKEGEERLKNPILGLPAYPSKEKLRQDHRVFQETEQALYREAMRHDETKAKLQAAIEANVKIQTEAYEAGYSRARADVERLKQLAGHAMQLLLDANDASRDGMHDDWKAKKNVLLKLLESYFVTPKGAP